MADPVDGARSLRPLPILSVSRFPSSTSRSHSCAAAGQRHGSACGAPNRGNGTGRRAGHQIWRMRRTKIRPKQLRPVNTSCVPQAKPTTWVRTKHGSKRCQKLKSTQALRSGMILNYLAGMSSVGRRSVNACVHFDLCRHNGF